ncbi:MULTISPECIES: hypothetical protein [Thermomonospora]|uniref:Prevent-host-death family protein n=1 Tax=Thermomonospora curvata (strain ATCC 19995 / DSM 43183 / JCM 3096 / KCTC 9072 / NBRC 15933 / NCIMB 10081 / Henssen B9) TaxID=471852 RepID=D1A3H5_THECD|nr:MULTISPECIES: hypothetical protein [Thermomonospora]ACY96100.1 hypothetical protein Tcur_0503 [Thermomonospora curvata DSM 43183]PKK15957.1 MAG: hypothetical protein BUE48_002450 [Thermomonospora sp. CIF 1]
MKAFPFSTLARDRNEVFAELDDADVLLERRDAENVWLVRDERYRAARDALVTLARSMTIVARANRVLAEKALAEDLPWLVWLPEGERRQCVRELLAHLLAGADTGELLPYARARRSWMSTALAWSDPETARVLSDPFDGTGGRPLDNGA